MHLKNNIIIILKIGGVPTIWCVPTNFAYEWITARWISYADHRSESMDPNCPKGLLCRDLSNFSVRPSSVRRRRHTQFWTSSKRNLLVRNSIRVQNRVRLGHFAKPHLMEDNPDVALDHFLTIPVSLRT